MFNICSKVFRNPFQTRNVIPIVLREVQKTCSLTPKRFLKVRYPYEDKVALVTGGSSGIGKACVEALLAKNIAHVMVTDVNAQLGQSVVDDLNSKGSKKCCFAYLDVTDYNNFDEIFRKTIKMFDHVDILINNAGMLDETQWEKMVDINYKGVVHGTLLGMEKYMVKYRSGGESIIVNVSSILGLDPMPPIPIYTSTKHGVMGLSRSYGSERHYDELKIRILVMCPGVTVTPLVERVEDKVRADYISEMVSKEFDTLPKQKMECCGMALIKMIEHGKNGSVWVVEGDECYEVHTPSRQERRL